jgi:threonine dehydrogenase-like Zn-dependent dehydrogenase
MLAVHLKHRRVEVKRVSRPRAPKGFALIRLLCGGICNTDLELQRGYYGFSGTPGHEFVGEVVEAEGRRDLIGRRVVGEINSCCGACAWCRQSLGRHCPKRTVLGIVKHPGAFREFLTLPERNLHVVPDSIPTRQAVFIEPLAAACEILDQVAIPCGSEVAVLGDGKLGLLIAQVLHAYGLRVHLFGRHKENLRIAARAGVATQLAPARLPAAAYSWVVEATGSSSGLVDAVRMTRPRGAIIMKSTLHGLAGFDTAPVIVNEITLVGSRCGRFEPAIDLLNYGIINVEDMIAEQFPLDRAPVAFRHAAKSGVLKVLLG